MENTLETLGYTLIKGRLYVEIAARFDPDDVYCAMAVIDHDDSLAVDFLRSVMQANWLVQRIGLLSGTSEENIIQAVNHAHVDFLWTCHMAGSNLENHLRKVGRRHSKLIRPFTKLDMLSEVTENLLTQNEKFREQATQDGLTGLYNRRSFNTMTRRFWERYQKSNTEFTLAIIDLDHFKWVNDNYGHQAGDEVLKQVSNILKTNQRTGVDFAFRYGGEEFAIVSVGTAIDEKKAYLKRLIELVRHKQIVLDDGRLITVTFSSGICGCTQADTFEDMLSKADAALYYAKEHGRDQICLYDTQIMQQEKTAK